MDPSIVHLDIDPVSISLWRTVYVREIGLGGRNLRVEVASPPSGANVWRIVEGGGEVLRGYAKGAQKAKLAATKAAKAILMGTITLTNAG